MYFDVSFTQDQVANIEFDDFTSLSWSISIITESKDYYTLQLLDSAGNIRMNISVNTSTVDVYNDEVLLLRINVPKSR